MIKKIILVLLVLAKVAVILTYAQTHYVSEIKDYNKPFTLPDLSLGPVNFYPRLTFQTIFDDNIYAATKDEKSDFIFSLAPGFLAAAGDTELIALYRRKDWSLFRYNPENLLITEPQNWPRQMYLLDYSPQFNWFSKYTDNDATDHYLNAGAYIPFSKTLINIRQSYIYETTTIVEASQRSARETISSGIAAGHQFSPKTSVYTMLSRDDYSYEHPALHGYTDYRSESWVNWNASGKITLSMGLIAGMFDIQRQPDQYYEQFRIRARYHPSERVWLDGSTGVQLRQFKGGSSTTEPVVSISAYYWWRERTFLSLSAVRTEYASAAWGNHNYLQTGAGFGISQQIGKRITFSVNPAYYNLDYIRTGSGASANRSDDYFSIGVSLNVRFFKHLDGNIFYNHLTRISDTSGDLTYNRAGVRLILQY